MTGVPKVKRMACAYCFARRAQHLLAYSPKTREWVCKDAVKCHATCMAMLDAMSTPKASKASAEPGETA